MKVLLQINGGILMFGFLKKNKKNDEVSKSGDVFAPVNGSFLKIEEVEDQVFSAKIMGDGFAVKPADGKVYSPVKGEVLSVFPTKHAIGIKMDNGVEVLVHMGVDTVELNGEPFDSKVGEGSKVDENTVLAIVDLDYLANAGKSDEIIVVFTNMDQIDDLSVAASGEVTAASNLGTVTAK